MLKTETLILANLVVAAEEIEAQKEAAGKATYGQKERLQHCIHIARKITNGKLDLEVFEKFFSIRFPKTKLEDTTASLWLDRFVDGWEWQQGDYSTRRALQQAAPEVYPTDLDEYFNRLKS